MAQKMSLKDRAKEREAAEKVTVVREQPKSPAVTMLLDTGEKDKQISAKVNRRLYESFTKICKMQGVSNNSMLNLLISNYVREHKELLDN